MELNNSQRLNVVSIKIAKLKMILAGFTAFKRKTGHCTIACGSELMMSYVIKIFSNYSIILSVEPLMWCGC